MGTADFRPPTNSTSLDRSPEKLSQVIMAAMQLPPKPNLVHGALLGKCVKYNHLIHAVFFRNSPTAQTGQRIFALDDSNNADSRKDAPFSGFVDIFAYLMGQILRNVGIPS